MADFESIVKKYVNEEGNIPATAIGDIVEGIKTAVGNEFVGKERYKAKLTEIDSLKEKLSNADDAITTAEQWKNKYEESEKALSDYKTEQTVKETRRAKEKAYKAIIKSFNLPDDIRELALRGVSFDDLELDEAGNLKESDKIAKSIEKDFKRFIQTDSKRGAETSTPPNNVGGSSMTKEQIMNIKDTTERQKAIADHHELFGF